MNGGSRKRVLCICDRCGHVDPETGEIVGSWIPRSTRYNHEQAAARRVQDREDVVDDFQMPPAPITASAILAETGELHQTCSAYFVHARKQISFVFLRTCSQCVNISWPGFTSLPVSAVALPVSLQQYWVSS